MNTFTENQKGSLHVIFIFNQTTVTNSDLAPAGMSNAELHYERAYLWHCGTHCTPGVAAVLIKYKDKWILNQDNCSLLKQTNYESNKHVN